MGEAKRKREMQEVGRLKLRVEGDWWNAYYEVDSVEIHLGSFAMRLARVESLKAAWMDLMRQAVSVIIHDITGFKPTWGDPRPAPEHERSGSA